MNKMKSKIWVEIIIDGFDIEPSELTKIIGVQPTSTAKKGDIYTAPNGKKIMEPFNEWRLESGRDTSVDLEAQMETLISKLKPFKKEFLDFCAIYSPYFNIVMHIFSEESHPYIGFDDRQIIKDMATLNAGFGIDYSIYDDEEYL